MPDVFVYDELPHELRVQIVHIWREAIGPWRDNRPGWKEIHDTIAREHGQFHLSGGHTDGERCQQYLLEQTSIDRVLDLIELSFLYVDSVVRKHENWFRHNRRVRTSPSDAIDELNERFRRAGVGYQYQQGKIIRIDSELTHSEIVKPALAYLSEPGFEGPRDEFLKAHAHYRAGETKDAITDANNALREHLEGRLRPEGMAV